MATYTTKAPIQTPAVFVKAGGGAMWSSACIDALLKAGYNPDAFGSYNHVRNEIAKARQRVADEAAGRLDSNGNPIRALPSDHHMANCQAGHLSMDATHRTAGGRGDNCAHLHDGYAVSRAPCMPQSEGPWDPQGSEHNVASRHEAASARAGRDAPPRPPQDAYDPALRERHEDHRTGEVVATRDPRNPREPIDRADWERQRAAEGRGAVDLGGGGDGGDAAAPAGVDGTGASIAKGEGESPTAAECINAFRRAATAQMEKDISDDRGEDAAADRARAASPEEQARLDREAADARRDARDTNESLGSAKGHCTRRDNEIHTRTGDPPDPARTSPADAEALQRNEDRRRNAEMLGGMVEDRASAAEGAADSAREAGCRAAEGERANAGVPPGSTRPGTASPPAGTGPARAPHPDGFVPPDQHDGIFGPGGDQERWNL